MEIHFLGAAETVTGSMHLVKTPKANVLLECGLFQGRRGESREKNERLPFRAREVDVCVLSHAHIDHCGLLPMLRKSGFRGRIYCTPATRDLCAAMLEDSAMIQAHDAAYLNRKIERQQLDSDPIEPLYDLDDVVGTLGQMVGVPYHQRTEIAPGVELTFFDAGHVLGSAVVALDVDDVGEQRRVVFTGDLGRSHMPILRDPEVPSGASFLITESTYGNRLHDPIERMDDELAETLNKTLDRGGKVIIPSFALERAQEVIYALKRLKREGRMPEVPVYVDSPLTVKVTDIFKAHPDCYDAEARRELAGAESPFEFEGLTYVQSVEESKRITSSSDPCVVISASGMCESGRILHHLKAGIGSPDNTVMIVGWQAQHTLGRRLVEGRMRVRIFGVERERRCDVKVLNGFSAHADRDGLVAFAEAVRDAGPLRRVALVHGDPEPQKALKEALEERGFPDVRIPAFRDAIRV
ncbi:MAG: MBL fold metallo-hydrolase [Sandaracinaceae bacterium]